MVPHPLYNLESAHDNDVALFQVLFFFVHMTIQFIYVDYVNINILQLSSRVSFHDHLLPVCLPPANFELKPNTMCTVIGWGKTEDKHSKLLF